MSHLDSEPIRLSNGECRLVIVQDELQAMMGEANDGLNLASRPPAVILMAGLQGAGKTTSVAKLARYLKTEQKKTVSVVSADVYRPAAIAQLATLAKGACKPSNTCPSNPGPSSTDKSCPDCSTGSPTATPWVLS